MTLQDAVIITGLPAEETARRIREMHGYKNPDYYATRRLCEGAGEQFLTEQAVIKEQEAELPSARVIQFPLPFGIDTRAVSNPLARCALFAAVKERAFFRDYFLVGIVSGLKIEFAGEQLNQDDHDTYLQLVRMAWGTLQGTEVKQTVNSVLAGLGRHTHREQRTQLFEQISRLIRGTVRITSPDGARYEGHLVDDATTPEDQKVLPRLRRHLAYRLNPKFAIFYAESSYTLIDFRQRLKIKGRGSELAKWLHFWVEGHAQQYAHKVETLREKSGSNDKTLKSFRQNLRKALDRLKEAGVIVAWQIDATDLVQIERTPSVAQQRHIAQAANTAMASMPSVAEGSKPAETARATDLPTRFLKTETVEKFRALWPRLDPHACQTEFDKWLEGRTTPRSYDAAFIGFAKKWAGKQA